MGRQCVKKTQSNRTNEEEKPKGYSNNNTGTYSKQK